MWKMKFFRFTSTSFHQFSTNAKSRSKIHINSRIKAYTKKYYDTKNIENVKLSKLKNKKKLVENIQIWIEILKNRFQDKIHTLVQTRKRTEYRQKLKESQHFYFSLFIFISVYIFIFLIVLLELMQKQIILQNKPIDVFSPQKRSSDVGCSTRSGLSLAGKNPRNTEYIPQKIEPSDIEKMKIRLNCLFKRTQGLLEKQKSEQNLYLTNQNHIQSFEKEGRGIQERKQVMKGSLVDFNSLNRRNGSHKSSENIFRQKQKKSSTFLYKVIEETGKISQKNEQTLTRAPLFAKQQRNLFEQKKNQNNVATDLFNYKTILSSEFKNIEKQPKLVNKESNKDVENTIIKVQEPQISWTKYIGLELKYQSLEKQFHQNDKSLRKQIEELKKMLERGQQKISSLTKQLIQEKENRQSQRVNLKSYYEKQLLQKHQHISELVEEVTGLSFSKKEAVFHQRIKDIINSNNQIQQLLSSKQELLLSRQASIKNFEESMDKLQLNLTLRQKQIRDLNLQIKFLREALEKKKGFDEVIRIQINNMEKQRQKVQILEDNINSLRNELKSQHQEIINLKNEKRISDLKSSTTMNRFTAQLGLQLHDQSNKIKNMENKYETLEDKYRRIQRQIKEKDKFIQQYLIGRTESMDMHNHIREVITKLEENLQKNNEEILEQEIRHLTNKLNFYQNSWKQLD